MNIDKIKLCADLSKQAYNYNHKNHLHDRKTDTYLFFEIIDNDLFCVYRGTENIKDVLIDLEISKQVIPYENQDTDVRVHKGFLRCYESVRIETTQYITNGYNKYNNIYFVGHSLGGAEALLNFLDIIYNFHDKLFLQNKKMFCITFGQPLVGNSDFVDSVNIRLIADKFEYYRYVNGDDAVTKLPKFCYKHVGSPINIGNKTWWKAFSFNDHKINNYIKSLKEVQ